MNPWLVAQTVFAAVAWYLSARAVVRVFAFAGYAGRPLAVTIQELRERGRGSEVHRLAELLDAAPLEAFFDIDPDRLSAEELISRAQRVLAQVAPPIRLLRGLATVATTLGLLAAVASLRSGLEAGTVAAMQTAATRALDSAVVGFVTGLPCWTAVGLCRKRAWQTYSEFDLVLLALRSGSENNGGGPEGDTETETHTE